MPKCTAGEHFIDGQAEQRAQYIFYITDLAVRQEEIKMTFRQRITSPSRRRWQSEIACWGVMPETGRREISNPRASFASVVWLHIDCITSQKVGSGRKPLRCVGRRPSSNCSISSETWRVKLSC